MEKFKVGEVVYFTLADPGQKFVLKVLKVYDGSFDGEVIVHRGYGGYTVGEFCPEVADTYYEVLYEAPDVMKEFLKAVKNYGKTSKIQT